MQLLSPYRSIYGNFEPALEDGFEPFNDVLIAHVEYDGKRFDYDDDYLFTRVKTDYSGYRSFTGESDQDFLFEILMGVIDEFAPEDRKHFVQHATIDFTYDLEQPEDIKRQAAQEIYYGL